jgi:hypothetical protein
MLQEVPKMMATMAAAIIWGNARGTRDGNFPVPEQATR